MCKIAVIGTRGVPATFGGVEKHCEELYSRLVNSGYKVVVYARSYYNKDEIAQYKGIEIKNIYVINVKGFETFLHSMVSTLHATFSDADIIHFHAQGPAIFSFIPRILAPKKIIVFTCHGIDWQRDKWNFIARTIIKLGELASKTFPHIKIAVSQYLVDYYADKYNVSVNKIFNGVNIFPEMPSGKILKRFNLAKDKYLIFVGRLVPEKAPELAIKAFAQVETEIKLVIVGGSAGTNEYVKQLKSLASQDDRVVFTDFLYAEDLQELYSNALAYISSSKLEGLPITVLEAMSYSLPVILSDIGPHKEVYDLDSSIGYNFKVNDQDHCTKTINRFLSDPDDKINEMGIAAKNVVEKYFDWDKVADLTSELYQSKLIKKDLSL